MSIAQKYLATIATIAVAVAVVFSFVATIQVAQAATVCPHTFAVNLKQGMTHSEVMVLQQFLNSDSATMVAATGPGSPGMETMYFGALTKGAVIRFQQKYAADVLAPVGLTLGTGYFGPSSRAKANMLCTGSVVTPTPTPSPGSGVAVAAGTQPANSLSPQGATRVPFTRFTLTAGNDGDVVINGVTVQKDGLGQDAAFAGIVLVDESNGMQVGTAKTFNSNHQAVIGGTFTIPRGTTKTFLIAGNMNSSLAAYAGEAPGIALVAVNTTATVSGSLPIVGAHNTNNATLSVGTLSLDVSNSFASNSNQTKEIGTVGHKFTGFRLTAGSAEDVRLRTITFNQAGSVSASDLANVWVNVAGTNYPTTLSSDGRYYTANLGSGVVIGKGNQVDVYVTADIVGSNASGRTVIFDVDKTTDIFGTGETYGYGISPGAGSTAVPAARTTTGLTTETNGTPYVYAAQITVSGASITQIGKANEVPAQNIAINVSNQPLGGYVVDLKGESVSVQSQVFTIASTTGSGTGLLTNVTLVDENGLVVAGPVDATYTSALVQTVTFTDTVTYKTGRHVYTLKGKVASTIGNGGTYIASTNPSTGWTTVRGETSGNTISLSGNGSFAMNTMTVRAGSVVVGRASSPASQAITPGGSQTLFVNFQYDATQSGENVRFSSIPATLTFGGGAAVTDLTSCAVYDGTTQLTTGSNTVNPSGASGATQTFTLDSPVTVTKGTVKTLSIRCNVSGSAANNATFAWDAGAASAYTFSGATSGTTITNATDASDTTVTMTVGSGSATVAISAGSPGYRMASAGSTDVTVGEYKLRASNETLNLTKLGLTLTNTASSSSGDLVKVTIWDGATKVGEAFFTGAGTIATSTLMTPVVLTRDVDKVLTIKADLAQIGTSQAVAFSGHLLAVDFLNAEASGSSSGTTVYPTGSTAVSGVRIFKSFPTVAKDTLSSTGIADGELMRFKVTADAAGPIGLTELNFSFATTSVTLSNVNVFAYTDSGYSQGVSGVQAGGMFSTTDSMAGSWNSSTSVVEFTAYNGSASTTLQIPAGTTRYFSVRGSVSGVVSGSSITTTLKGGSSFVTCTTPAAATTNPLCKADAAGLTNDFIWSPNSTTTAVRADLDWTGGYGVSGLPQNGLTNTRSN